MSELREGVQMSVSMQEQSEQMKTAAAEMLPPEVLAVFNRSIDDLVGQGSTRQRHLGGRHVGVIYVERRHRLFCFA